MWTSWPMPPCEHLDIVGGIGKSKRCSDKLLREEALRDLLSEFLRMPIGPATGARLLSVDAWADERGGLIQLIFRVRASF